MREMEEIRHTYHGQLSDLRIDVVRLGLLATQAYDVVQRHFETHLPRDVHGYREDHALLVTHAKTLCRPRPKCGECPLRPDCPFGRRQRS